MLEPFLQRTGYGLFDNQRVVRRLNQILDSVARIERELTDLKDALIEQQLAEPESEPDVSESEPTAKVILFPDKNLPKLDPVTGQAMEHCERMHLWATSLPCAMREECYMNPKCHRLTTPQGQILCAVCHKPFTPTNPLQKFCSPKCRTDSLRNKKL